MAAVGSTVVSGVSQGLQYSAQSQQAAQARTAALASAADQDRQLTLRELQQQDATGQQLHDQNLKEAEQSANVSATFAANGTAGISLDALVSHVHNQAETNRQTIGQNYANVVEQTQQQQIAVGDQAQGRINANPAPSALGLGLGLLGTGLNGLAGYNKANPSTDTGGGGFDFANQTADSNYGDGLKGASF